MLILVRLLEPAQYGQFSVVTAVIGFISVFAHQNFMAHTLQVRDDQEVHYQDHFVAGGLIQLLMFLITNCVAIGLHFVDSFSSLSPLVHVMSIGFLLEWPCELRLKMLERSLDWARLRALHAIGLVVSSIVAVIMGYMGAGVYALLLPGLLVTLPFIFDLFFLQKWKPSWSFSRERYVPAFRFGISRMTSGLVGRLRRLIESGVVVYLLGLTSAGLLERAVSLGLMFCQRAAAQIMYTLYPFITKLDPGTEEYRRASSIVLRGVTWFTIPMVIILSILSEPLVQIVYGGNWNNVVPLVPVAVILGGVSAVSYVVYMLLLAHREERRCLRADFIELTGTLIALAALLQHGLIAYLLGLLIVRIAVLLYATFWLYSCGGVAIRQLSDAIGPASVSGGVAYAVCQGVLAMTESSVQAPVAALLYILSFFLVYLLSLRMLFNNVLSELVGYLPAHRIIERLLFFRAHPI